ncbi:hypothetical protein JXQ70_10310 [bacterium]|nr:hypothetical protein [bacterium]
MPSIVDQDRNPSTRTLSCPGMNRRSGPIRITLLICLIGLFLLPLALQAKQPDQDVRETVKMWLLYKLKTDLNLDQEKCLAVLALSDQLDQARRDYYDFEHEQLIELVKMLDSGLNDPERFETILNKIDQHQHNLNIIEANVTDELKKILDPIQRAKFIVLRQKLKEKIRDIIHTLEKRERRRPERMFDGPDGPGHRPPPDENAY